MGHIVDAINGETEFVTFSDFIEPVRENPADVGAWISLAERCKWQATASTIKDYSERWHKEAWDVLKKAVEVNPANIELGLYIEKYRLYLESFHYSVK